MIPRQSRGLSVGIAQRLDTARQPDMPESAIATGFVDYIQTPEEIANTISRIAHEVKSPNDNF
jgi:chemotaxis response regulator CheB